MSPGLARGFHATEGSVSVIVAGLALVLVGFSGLAVDVASIVYWKRQLQAATDAAALAAAFDPARASEIVAQSLEQNGLGAATVTALDVGGYSDDPSLSTTDRFDAGSGTDAVRLTTSYNAPLYFLKPVVNAGSIQVSSETIAHNLPLAAIAIGTGVLDADTGVLDGLTEGLTGNPLGLSEAEITALNATRIGLFPLFEALAEAAGSPAMTIAQVQAASLNLAAIAGAAKTALAAQAPLSSNEMVAQAALTRVALEQQASKVARIADVIAMYAHQKRAARDMGTEPENGNSLSLSPMNLLTGYLHATGGDSIINFGDTYSIPGLATVSIDTIFHRGPPIPGGSAVSGTMAGPVGSSASATAARVRLRIALLPITVPLLPAVNLTIPMTIDLGQGTANLSSISCGADIANSTDIAIAAQSGLVRLSIGTVSDADLADFATNLTPTAATLAPFITLNQQVSVVPAGQATLHFTRADIATGTTKSVDGLSSLTAAVPALVVGAVPTINIPLIGPLTKTLLSNAIVARLSTVFSALGTALEPLLASLGVRAGYIDVRAESVRCGDAVLVN